MCDSQCSATTAVFLSASSAMKVTSSPPTSALRMRSRRKGNVMWMMWVTWLVKVLEAGVPPESRLSEIVTATKHPNTSTSLTTLPILESYALPTGRPPPFHTPDGYLQLSVTSSAHLLFVSVNDKVVSTAVIMLLLLLLSVN
ncbi:hypothetical protein E2C01_088437 [Portunus trituberculatus]|uniref:Uncharacterized protein n=1 Tax=Portunus trituberculatus TaxID=210409 RepID=A0A5B7JFZ5_PORTR|nr:hypothetical protein [Portunus trituberculatus]